LRERYLARERERYRTRIADPDFAAKTYERQAAQKRAKYAADSEFRDYTITRVQARRTDLLGPEISNVRELVAYLVNKFNGICQLCFSPVTGQTGNRDPSAPSPDHVIPLSLGGSHSLDNLQLSHLRCNLIKGNRI
jgi:5-methylcytosine-specific restriction endonuclease McrA